MHQPMELSRTHPNTPHRRGNRCRLSRFAMFLLGSLLFLAGCGNQIDRPGFPQFTLPPTVTPTATITPSPTSTATSTPTPTPAVRLLYPPPTVAPDNPEPTPAGALIAQSEHLAFYMEPDNYWAQHIIPIGTLIEEELQKMARLLQTRIPTDRVVISIQDPSTSPLVRGMQCPARGLYYADTLQGPMAVIFADENTSRIQVVAVAAHELAHHLIFHKFGPEGGDTLLNEGLANWLSRDTWSKWQGWRSFDVAVRHYRQLGIYLPLEETLYFDPQVGERLGLEDCFSLRDLRYNEWASFTSYLIDQYGLEIMTELWKTRQDPPPARHLDRRRHPIATVDYERILGKPLSALEQEWLASLYIIHAD